MRECIVCRNPMYTSWSSVWINGKNYDAHVKCLKSIKGCKKLVGIADKDIVFQCGSEMDDGSIFYCKNCSCYLKKTKEEENE